MVCRVQPFLSWATPRPAPRPAPLPPLRDERGPRPRQRPRDACTCSVRTFCLSRHFLFLSHSAARSAPTVCVGDARVQRTILRTRATIAMSSAGRGRYDQTLSLRYVVSTSGHVTGPGFINRDVGMMQLLFQGGDGTYGSTIHSTVLAEPGAAPGAADGSGGTAGSALAEDEWLCCAETTLSTSGRVGSTTGPGASSFEDAWLSRSCR